MTWGSNPTHEKKTCKHCNLDYIDDWNPPTHYMICRGVSWWSRFRAWWGNHN